MAAYELTRLANNAFRRTARLDNPTTTNVTVNPTKSTTSRSKGMA